MTVPRVAVPAVGAFSGSLAWLVEPAVAGFRDQVADVSGLSAPERAVVVDAAAAALAEVAHRRACRVLVLELHAARVGGRLTAADPAGRWAEYLELSARPGFWSALSEQYPPLVTGLRQLLARRCGAMLTMLGRLAADRDSLALLAGCGLGELREVGFGAGDSHRGGQSVVVLGFDRGTVVYKPRSVRVDVVLAGVLDVLLADVAEPVRIRVPGVLARAGGAGGAGGEADEYGWAEHVAHRYCQSAAELSAFYLGIGHWLAVMRLLGGTDLHAENVIACGPVPVVVDCETLFTPTLPYPATGFGQAYDQARELVAATVLRTGMLPVRGTALGWRGVDLSAVGALPGQQPVGLVPVLVGEGTDDARIGFEPALPDAGTSHPSPEPALAGHWDQILTGFGEATATMAELDRAGELEPLLARFGDCPVRMVLRGTEAYAELSRMLWHPVSLHDPAAADDRARRVLAGMAKTMPGVPDDPAVIEAEVADLRGGDIPYFGTTPRRGRLTGPAGTTWLPERDLVTAALERWRNSDLDLERHVIQGTLVSAYLNDGSLPKQRPLPAGRRRLAGLDQRRRALAARLIGELVASAFTAADDTVTWIAPVFQPTGWALAPLNLNVYGGLHGVALLLAAYQRETAAGRAEEVAGAAALLEATLRSLRMAEDEGDRLRRAGARSRPLAPGGWSGLGSQVWSWLTLHEWGCADGLARAQAVAAQLPASIAADQAFDLISGMAGAIVPLLKLAAVTADDTWVSLATGAGDRLIGSAIADDGCRRWPSQLRSEGLGGFGHGVTGIGWALARLAIATGAPRFAETADAAFGYEDRLYERSLDGWLDLRGDGRVTAAWCHGSVGIGLAAADLARRGWPVGPGLLVRAVRVTTRHELLWNHSLCHGDMGTWELSNVAAELGAGSAGPDPRLLSARIIGSIERNGPVSGLLRDTFTPGLMHGLGGVCYQLLRMHPQSDLVSALIPA